MGILDNLMDPEAAEGAPGDRGLGDPPEDASIQTLRPAAVETAVMSQTAVAEQERQADRERQKEPEASASPPVDGVPPGLPGLHRGPPPARDRQASRLDPAAPAKLEAYNATMRGAVASLTTLLKHHRWSDITSEDPEKRAQAEAQQLYIRKILRVGCRSGQSDTLAQVWARHAPPDAPRFEDMVKMFSSDAAPRHPTAANDGASGQPRAPSPATRERSSAKPRPQPMGPADIVTLPLVAVGAAGSLVLAGVGKAVRAAEREYVKRQANGHGILARQLEGSAGKVADLAGQLKQQGFGDLCDAIGKAGHPASVVDGMGAGGPHEALGQRFDGLMTRPEVAKTYRAMQAEVDRFAHLSRRYAKTGADLHLDTDTPVVRGQATMAAATEGMPMKDRQGKFQLVQDRIDKMVEDIRAMIQQLLSKIGLASAP